jgi:glycosyltransferase involved in cell wall biosynthesis
VVCDHNDFRKAPPGNSAFGRFKMRRTMRWSYPRADRIVAVSAGVARTVAALADVPEHLVSVIHNPARAPSADALCAGAPAAPAWAGHDGPKLIAIGKFKEQKKFSLLLSAFAKVRSTARARLLILGEGPLRGELEALKSRLGLDGAVDMPGFVSDPHPYLAKADLFVLSSAWEGFSNVIVEALACGTPVVSTDCPSGPGEILEGGRYGKLVPVGDAEALAQAMLASLGETHDRTALIGRAAHFSIDNAAEKYLRLLVPEGA